MKMKIFLITLVIFQSISCNLNPPAVTCSMTLPPEPDYPAITELTVANYLDNSSIEDMKMWQAIVDAFEKKYPDINLIVDNRSGEAYHYNLKRALNNNTMPDTYYLWSSPDSSLYQDSAVTEDLTTLVDSSNYVPAAMVPQPGNGLWCLPISVTANHVLYTNRTLLAMNSLTVPTTYDELKTTNDSLKAAGLETILITNSPKMELESILLGVLSARLGGSTWISDAAAGINRFDDQVFINSLTLIKDIMDSQIINMRVLNSSYDYGLSQFQWENAPFFMGKGSDALSVEASFTKEEAARIEFNTFPSLTNEVLSGNVSSVKVGGGMAVKAGLTEAKRDAAIKWTKFFAGPEAAVIRAEHKAIPSAYIIDTTIPDVSPFIKRSLDFHKSITMCDSVDNFLPEEIIAGINGDISEMILGSLYPSEVAMRVEQAVRPQ